MEILPVLEYLCLLPYVSVGSAGIVTGEASTRPCWVHLLPRWQVTQSVPTVAIGNGWTCEKGFLLQAIWRTMGEHLAPQGYRHLLTLVDWHKRQHVINFII